MADWSQLPKELIEEISNRLGSPFYLLRFRSVCSSWRTAVKPRTLTSRFPFLPNKGISDNAWGFHLSKHSIILLGLSGTESETNPDRWLIKIEENAPGTMRLLNPFSKLQISPLPHDFPKLLDSSNFRVFELGQEYVLHYVHFMPLGYHLNNACNLYMEKIVFMALGSDGRDFVLLTIHISGKLVRFKSGDARWTLIDDMLSPYDDVILFQGNFYAVDHNGRAVLVGLTSDDVSLVANPVFGGDKKLLVESNGELLMVDRYLSSFPEPSDLDDGEDNEAMGEKTVRFKVFKLHREEQKWVELKSLGNRVLFLSDNCSFSASAADLSGCKNCIFFTENFFYTSGEDYEIFKSRDIGVYDLESGSIAPLADFPEYSKLFWPPPDWLKSNTSEVQTQLEDLTM